MTITAKIIADSVSGEGLRLTTFLLRYPRFIHAELMTHRMFSRNASSSRAIPVKKLIADIRRDPASFSYWGKNQKGMQASEELTGFSLWAVQSLWIIGMWIMTTLALAANKLGAHKQTVNRMVEPWSHINVVVSSTNYANWFALRDHPDAMPEIHQLAKAMLEAYRESLPELLPAGVWHLPFTTTHDSTTTAREARSEKPQASYLDYIDSLNDRLRRISTARCARTSYLTHDGRQTTPEEDIALCDRLLASEPLHASPAEHQAMPDTKIIIKVTQMRGDEEVSWVEERWEHPELHGNFEGWIQHRKMLDNECVEQETYEGKYHA
jgi:thymidylate synthase ThyX